MQVSIPDFEQIKVLVVGDLMLDRYWHGPTSRISPEAPVPVVKIEESEERPGGAGNVALNIAVLAGQPTLMGLTGNDEAAEILEDRLNHYGVNCQFVKLDGCTTITKLRILSRHQQLIRLDFEDGFHCEKAFADSSSPAEGSLSAEGSSPAEGSLSAEGSIPAEGSPSAEGSIPAEGSLPPAEGSPLAEGSTLAKAFAAALPEHDVVLFSDYRKGTLRELPRLIALAKAQGKKVIIDPKGDDFSIYQGATLLTPNLAEFETIVGHCENDEQLLLKAEQLRQQLSLQALLITRSEKGMTLIEQGQAPVHIPTRAREVYDVTGAGDTVIATLATAIAAELSMHEATQLANLAASVVVGKVGTATVTVHELRAAMRQLSDVEQGIVSQQRLIELVSDAKNHAEKVIMTNGCFDILHAGHVTYLEQAKSLGDRLVIAVNDDDSVKRIKGPERPVNSMDRRMQVLAGLSCVDWVVPFFEDTPTQIICTVAPNVLVKGGDNDPHKIPGGDCVRAQGGEVLIMQYLDNCSTTGLIRSIRAADDSVENKK